MSKVVQFEDGYIIDWYDSVAEAADESGINESSIRACLKGKRSSAGEYEWYRMEEDEIEKHLAKEKAKLDEEKAKRANMFLDKSKSIPTPHITNYYIFEEWEIDDRLHDRNSSIISPYIEYFKTLDAALTAGVSASSMLQNCCVDLKLPLPIAHELVATFLTENKHRIHFIEVDE